MDIPKGVPEFGIKRENEERRDGGCAVVFDPQTQMYAVGKQLNGRLRLFSGGVDSNEDLEQGVLREVVEESGLYDFSHVENIGDAICHFYNSLKNVNRFAYTTCFLVILKSSELIPAKLEEHEKFSLDWATPKEMLSNWEERNQEKDHDHWIFFLKKSVNRAIELGYDTSSEGFR